MHPQYINTTKLGGLGEKERSILANLTALEKPTITVQDLSDLIDTRTAANLFLSRLARKGWLYRIRRGVYATVPLFSKSSQPVAEEPLAMAMRLFAPCYISGWSAAQHWALTEQISNVVIVYSAKAQRKSMQTMGGVTYRIRRVREDNIFGTTRIWSGTVSVEIADLHRTVIDVLDDPGMGGGGRQTIDIVRTYWSKPQANPQALLAMALRLERGTLFKRLGFTGERFGSLDAAWVKTCRQNLSTGVSLLDPAGPDRGRILSRWRLRINVPIEEAE